MTTGRSYNQYCGVARALDLVGERWALLIVRDLVIGPKRFTDLRAGLPGIATNVLSQRLKELERNGIVVRRTLPPPAASTVYELSEYGRELETVMLAFGRWGARTLGERHPDQTGRSEWLAVALKAFHRPDAAPELIVTIGLRFPDGEFTVELDGGRLEIRPGLPDTADLEITAEPGDLIGYLAGAPAVPEALDAEGDDALFRRLPQVFAFGLSPA